MYIARDKNGSLWLYNEKPIRQEEEEDWTIASPTDTAVGKLDTNMFPELKWEDEPLEVNLTDINKSIINDKDCIDEVYWREVYWREVRNNAAIAAMQGLLLRWQNINLKLQIEDVSSMSIKLADSLVKQLQSKEVEKNSNK